MPDSSSHPVDSSEPEELHDAHALVQKFAEFRFQTVVESVTDYAVFMLDRNGIVVTWNAGAERIKGYRADEIIGRHFSRFYQPGAIAAGRPSYVLEQAAKHGHHEEEGWRVRKDGSAFWAFVTVTAVHDESGSLRGFIKITRDMTERKRLDELEVATQRLDVFIATLAHELRNQLAPLQNTVGVLQSLPSSALVPALAHCRDVAGRQITQLVRLVDDLLDIGRIKSDKVTLDEASVNLRDVVTRSVDGMQAKLDARGQRVDVTLPGSAVTVRGDDARLVQVLYNLLDNASKFSARNARIGVDVRVDQDTAEIRVVDHGIGIAPDALERVFGMFEQPGGAAGETSGGLGLGLAISRKLVELHGGSIAAESAGVGQGSTFVVRLPIERLGSADVTAPAPNPTPLPDPNRLRIVIVDDNVDSADTLGTLLRVKGYAPRVAYNGRDAIALAREYAPHLMLIDLTMPEPDGFDVLRAVRSSDATAGTVCVALSGHVRSSDRANTQRAGFNDHFAKPISMSALDELLKRVDAEVRHRRDA
jgi:PAS domain S-box-containing protein